MAAEPILAASLWNGEEGQESCSRPTKQRRLATGCATIDNSLNGGFDYGSISCVSSEADSGNKELSYSMIVTHLLLSDQSEATIIDTTNSFDVRRLHKKLVSGLHGRRIVDDAKAEAIRVLDRVRIMKAFDFVGMAECVAELRESLETRQRVDPSSQAVSGQDAVKIPRATIGDSEDEEDMLDEPASPVKQSPPSPKNKVAEEEHHQNLLIIDNITFVASPVLKNSHVQGQALLASFMRSLAHLTHTHMVCTLLHNATISYSTNSTTDPTPSIFSSCTLRPALGKSFAATVDVHLLLHRIPLTAADAKSVYAAHNAIPKSSQKLASVLEVMQDRHSERIGRWSAFRTDADGYLTAVTS